MQDLRKHVFYPAFCVVAIAAVYSLIDPVNFVRLTTALNDQILRTFDWLYGSAVLYFLLLVIILYLSPAGKIRLGSSEPILSKPKWFSITLSTTIASGILFWGPMEPLYHFHNPPAGLNIEAGSPAAVDFSMSTMFMHWTFIPYAIYTLAGVAFAIGYYNMKGRFGLSSLLQPLLGNRAIKWGTPINIIALFSLVAGMAASLGAGILVLNGGFTHLGGLEVSALSLGVIALIIVLTFVVSATSGLQKGIRILSTWNVRIFVVIGVGMLAFGPTAEIIEYTGRGLSEFITTFPERSTIGFSDENKSWSYDWTLFYWANWLAWTPITAIFLGRIAVGRTVREFIRFNLLYPSLFGIAWMGIFSASSLSVDRDSGSLWAILENDGNAGEIIFSLFDTLPWAQVFAVIYLITAFLSYVTAADSNTSAMSGISAKGINPSSPEAPKWIQVVWGGLIGIIAWVMISFGGGEGAQGLDGIRMLSNLGGFPALLLVIAVSVGVIRLIISRR